MGTTFPLLGKSVYIDSMPCKICDAYIFFFFSIFENMFVKTIQEYIHIP